MDSLEEIKKETIEGVSEAKDIVIERAKDAVDEIKAAGEKVICAANPDGGAIDWEKVLYIGLGAVSIGVIVWAAVSAFQSKDGKKKKGSRT